MTDNVSTVKKSKKMAFFKQELLIYTAHIYLFFWLAFLSSGSLSNEELLI
ncbi:hypothetical protein VIBNIWn13_1020001 [Vibrio nigripulchritudo Wn13]|nr:hypothetical protein VIBNIENn2_890107 [Vibrio nigripulchritudo ENn2]CCO42978.1 hypothetical protein VIBNISFn135_910001 [Vibrio nigripulchritudo SFn135]CCO50614.1 hypothetical protein VIBNIWn13_1020001 [Vibrio nigripulchritudo Wn13]